MASVRDLLEQPAATPSINHRHLPGAASRRYHPDRPDGRRPHLVPGSVRRAYGNARRPTPQPGRPGGWGLADELFADERGEATIFVPCTKEVRPMGRVAPLVIPPVELATIVHPGPTPASTAPTGHPSVRHLVSS